jgi:hypothetical protein
LVETISGKYCRDVFHEYFLPLYILQCSKPDKNIRNMSCWEPAAGYWRDSGVFFFVFGEVWRRGKSVTLFCNFFEGWALHYLNLSKSLCY